MVSLACHIWFLMNYADIFLPSHVMESDNVSKVLELTLPKFQSLDINCGLQKPITKFRARELQSCPYMIPRICLGFALFHNMTVSILSFAQSLKCLNQVSCLAFWENAESMKRFAYFAPKFHSTSLFHSRARSNDIVIPRYRCQRAGINSRLSLPSISIFCKTYSKLWCRCRSQFYSSADKVTMSFSMLVETHCRRGAETLPLARNECNKKDLSYYMFRPHFCACTHA